MDKEVLLLAQKGANEIGYDEEDSELIAKLVEEGWGIDSDPPLHGAGRLDSLRMPFPPIEQTGHIVKFPNRYTFRKRNLAQITKDREDISRLYLEGKTYQQISDWIAENRSYQLSIGTIGRDIKSMLREWQIAYLSNINVAKSRELLRLDNVERELWETWAKSQGDIVESQKTVITGKNDSGASDEEEIEAEVEEMNAELEGVDEQDGVMVKERGREKRRKRPPMPGKQGSMSGSREFVRVRTFEKRTSSYGDIKILEMILKVIELRSKILGIVTAQADVNVNWRIEAKRQGYDPDEVLADMQQKYLDAGGDDGDGAVDGEFVASG